jgi:exodeoxyribonuclease V alpha subunit
MKPVVDLSPLGTARPDAEDPFLGWLGPVRARLASAFGIEPEVAYLAWEVARWPAELDLQERQALALLVLTALIGLRQGSTRLPLQGDPGRALRLDVASRLLEGQSADENLGPERALDVADRLLGSGRAGLVVGEAGDFKPLVVAGSYLYLQKMRALEARFADALRRRIFGPGPQWEEEAVGRVVSGVQARPGLHNGRPIALSPDQLAAVRAAVRFHLAVISGGPGTGKTTIVVSILRTLAGLGVTPDEMVLAAPTGKSAHRLGEKVRSELASIASPAPEEQALRDMLADPLTLHSLLGYSGTTGRFLYHENNRLAGRVVVVDEASMVDLVLMERLVRSLRDDARLVLLGDDHQLPSVEAGAVLRDLIAGQSPLGPRAVRLTESYRMSPENPDGRNILTVSRAIDEGTLPAFAPERTDSAAGDGPGVIREQPSVAAVAFRGVEFVAAPEGTGVLGEFLERWHTEMIRGLAGFDALVDRDYVQAADGFGDDDLTSLRTLFQHFDRARILCLTRVRSSGAERINATLHRRVLESRNAGFGDELMPGEPVMMLVNDYGRSIFNGDQGLVLRVSDGGRPATPMVVFPRAGGFIALRIESLRSNLVRSFALTVHKAQGSEYDHVALVLPDADIPINAREILYTALTRARTSVTLLGTRDIFARGIGRRIDRFSGLADLLQGPLDVGDPR